MSITRLEPWNESFVWDFYNTCTVSKRSAFSPTGHVIGLIPLLYGGFPRNTPFFVANGWIVRLIVSASRFSVREYLNLLKVVVWIFGIYLCSMDIVNHKKTEPP